MPVDFVILAGGRAAAEMAELTGTPLRALFPYGESTFIECVTRSVRSSRNCGRIAIVGPRELQSSPAARLADLVLEERNSIVENLFLGVDTLKPGHSVVITASDNPLLTSAGFDDFIDRSDPDAAVTYPIMPYANFLNRFPHAANIGIDLRDGKWIGGDCVKIKAEAIEPLKSKIAEVLAARKSLYQTVKLLGPLFAVQFAMKRVGISDVERRASKIAGMSIRFVPDCAPEFAIDIDDPEDWNYLMGRKEQEQTLAD